MPSQARLILHMALALCLAAPAPAQDAEALQKVIDALPYPGMNFDLGVAIGEREVAIMHLGSPDSVLSEAEARLKTAPEDARAHLQRALALKALDMDGFEEEYERATDLGRAAVEADADDVQARLVLAQSLFESGDTEAALPLIEGLAADQPDLWWPHFALARSGAAALWDLVAVFNAQKAGDYETEAEFLEWFEGAKTPALEGLGGAIYAAREDTEALGNLLQQLADNATAHLARAREAAPDEPSVRLFGVLIHLQAFLAHAGVTQDASSLDAFAAISGELDAVSEEFPAYVEITTFARWATVCRAMVNCESPDFMGIWRHLRPEDRRQLTRDELATLALIRQLDVPPSDVYELAAVYAMLHGDLHGAIEHLKQSTVAAPTDPERWEAYIGTLTRTGDLELVAAESAEGLKHLDDAILRCALAKTSQKLGDLEAAEEHLVAVVEQGGEWLPFARLMLGVLRLKQGDAEGALELLQAAVADSPGDPLAHAAIGAALASEGEEDEAKAHFIRAKELGYEEPLPEA